MMSTTRPSVSPSDDGNSNEHATGVDTTPLLSDDVFVGRRSFHRPPSLRGAASFLRRASSHRMMSEPSVRVREAAAEQIEERQSDWAYSRPVVMVDLIWNFAFIVVSVVVLILSREERPSMPLRLWLIGYVFQCMLHMICVHVEYTHRIRLRSSSPDNSRAERSSSGGGWSPNSSSGSDVGSLGNYALGTRVTKHVESANTMFSFIWWIIGFYWISSGGQDFIRDSPQLYWLCIIFLAFDVFFVVVCVALACIIGIAVCCCLPCIIAILYAVADQEGATKDDIECLPKYIFRRPEDFEKQNVEIQESFGGIMTECGTDTPIEHAITLDDAECCICLCAYNDGTVLRELPCRHHFHCTCIDKWLYINATCPLCKFNILKNGSQSVNEEV